MGGGGGVKGGGCVCEGGGWQADRLLGARGGGALRGGSKVRALTL